MQRLAQTTDPQQQPRTPANRSRQYLDPLPVSQADVFKQLLAEGLVAPIPTAPWKPPYPAWYNHDAHCEYHGGAAGHPTENCYALRQKIYELVNMGKIKLNPVEAETALNTDTRGANEVTHGVNMIEFDYSEDDEEIIDEEINGLFKMEIVKPGEQHKEVMLSSPDSHQFVLNLQKRDLTSQASAQPPTHGPRTIFASNVVISNISGIGGITRSGRCYSQEYTAKQKKGKEKIGEENTEEENVDANLPMKEPVSQEEVEQFLKYIKNSDYNIVEQLSKTPARISLLSLILHSELHRQAILRVLNESHVSQDTSVEQVERLVAQIQAPNYITFSDDELGPEGRGHTKPLNIAISYGDYHVSRVLVDNGSCFNVLPLSTFDFFKVDPTAVRVSSITVRAFNGTRVQATGEVELPIKIGPHIFHIDFHIIDTKSSYAMLLGRPWIHAAGAVPSSLHQKLKYVRNCCLIEINAEQEYLIKQVTGPSGVQSAEEEEGDEMLRGFEVVAVTPMVEGSVIYEPRLPWQVESAARSIVTAIEKDELKRRVDHSQPILYPRKHEGTFGLGFKPKPADREQARSERRERKRARLAGEDFNEPLMQIPRTLKAFRSAGFINLPDTQQHLYQRVEDLHIATIEDEDLPDYIKKIAPGEDGRNYTVTQVVFPTK